MLFHTEEFQGFTIRVYAEPEDMDVEGSIATGDDAADAEYCELVRSGEVNWFCAKVTASKNGIELAKEFLRGCDDTPYGVFIDASGYFGDMRAIVVAEAKQAILDLGD